MKLKSLIAGLVAVVSIGVVIAPSGASASAPVHHEEVTPNGCMRQGGACPRKDEGFTSWCCNNLTCRGGVCGG